MTSKRKPAKSRAKKPAHKKAEKRAAGTWAFTLRCTLQDMSTPVWRLLRVPSNMNLFDLHYVLQSAMEWEDCHPHQFMDDRHEYAPRGFNLEDARDSERYSIAEVLPVVGSAISYNYDFGDDWMVEVVLEAEEPPRQAEVRVELLDAEGVSPYDDSGGPPGYEDMVDAFRDEGNPGHYDAVEWFGEDFDPDNLDIDALRAAVASWDKAPEFDEFGEPLDVGEDDSDDEWDDDLPTDPLDGLSDSDADDLRTSMLAGAWILGFAEDDAQEGAEQSAGFAIVMEWGLDGPSPIGMANHDRSEPIQAAVSKALQTALKTTQGKPTELLVTSEDQIPLASECAQSFGGCPVRSCPPVWQVTGNILAIMAGEFRELEDFDPRFRLPVPGINGADIQLTKRYLAVTTDLLNADFSKVLPHPVGFRMAFPDGREVFAMPVINPAGATIALAVCTDEHTLRQNRDGLARIAHGQMPDDPPATRLFMLCIGVDEVAGDQVTDIEEMIPGVFREPLVAALSVTGDADPPAVPAEDFALIADIAEVLVALAEPSNELAAHLPPRDGASFAVALGREGGPPVRVQLGAIA